jgi:hypothetical protein
MSTIHFHKTTTVTPEQYIAGLTDFGPGRAELFGNSADDYLKVHDQGPTEADVTEGSGGVWEREQLRLVGSRPRRREDDRFEHLGRPLRPHLRPQTQPPTARRTSTTSWSARARTSRDGSWGSCLEALARAGSRRRS